MRDQRHIRIVGRRDFLVGGAAAVLLASLVRTVAAQEPKAAEATASAFEQALDKILGDAKPLPGKAISIEMPEIAENGNTVPYAIQIESPMTAADHIKAVHVLSAANPLANIASFGFTPLMGRATVASRMRLAKSQDVVIVAQLSNGRFIMGRRTVKVTIGGCGG